MNTTQSKFSRLLLFLVTLLAGIAASAQTTTENVLTVGDFTGRLDKAISVPVYLNNTDEVVAAQFDITLPFAVAKDGVATMSNRADGHSVSFHVQSGTTYRVVVMSMENHPLRGNSGLLLRMPMQAYDDGNTATPYPVSLTNVVLTDAKGNNIATSATGTGSFTVSRDDLPDLTVTNVVPAKTTYAPGDEITVTFDVKNIGTGATGAGWTEKVYLESETGERTFIVSQSYSSTLAANSTASRTVTATLPTLLHIDGSAKVYIEIIGDAKCGELLADQGNNAAYSAASITLSKRLYLSASGTVVREGVSYGYVTLTFSRSGDWSTAETFTVSSSVDGLFTCSGQTMPCQVTIPKGYASTSLRIVAVDDKIVRAREADITVAADHDYEAVSLHLTRIDNDRNPLTLELVPTTLAEGKELTIHATRGGELTDDLTMNVSCTHADRFDSPFTLHFAPGEYDAVATANAIGDDVPQLDATVRFTAQAEDYQTATAMLTLTDDDRPQLSLALSVPAVMENMFSDPDADPVVATISFDRSVNYDQTVWLTSDNNTVAFQNNRIVVPAGSMEVQTPLSIDDDVEVNGQRAVTLTASLYLAADLKAAPTGDRANATAQLTVNDDEQPYLTLSSHVKAVAEGSSATVTVTRHVADASAPLAVTMSSTDSRVSFSPQPVTIAAGQTSANFTAKIAQNSVEGDNDPFLITAQASDITDGWLLMQITDRTLPDAVNPSIQTVGEHFFSGLTATVRATIRNYGTATLGKGMTIDFYLCSSNSFRYYYTTHNFFTGTTDKDIPAGGEETFEFEAQIPQLVGNWWIFARLNQDGKISEFNTSNNLTQVFCPIKIEAPFEVETIVASPADCLPGDIITVKGRMKAVEGSQLNGQTVRVSLTGGGHSSQDDTQIDANGNFEMLVRADRSAHGYLTVRALALGQTEPAKTTQVHVYNMSLGGSSRWTVDENIQTSGSLSLQNTSAKSVTITQFATSTPMPEETEITFDTSALIGKTIAAGGSVTIPYTVTGKKPSSAWQTFTVTATAQEGIVASHTVNYYCQATNAYLAFTPRELKTTMLFNADRTGVAVTVKNYGKKESGPISELITGSDWVMSDFGNNRTLQPGEQATLHLTFLAQDYMHADRTYKAYLQLTPANGTAAGLPITITTTGNEYSTFSLQVTDVYGKAKDDYSHVDGAEITVSNARTGMTVFTGTADAKGQWQTTQMKEGLYKVTVKASRHKTVTTSLAVGPGEDCELTVLLPYQAFLADFVVNQDLETNVYTMKQYFNIDLLAPQAIVVATIDDNGFACGEQTMDIILRNVGQRAATDIRLTFPVVAGYTFTPLNAMPAVMQPGDKHVLQVAVTGPETGKYRLISKLRMHYGFDIKGETLTEDDDYQALFGCTASGSDPTPIIVDPNPDGGGTGNDDDGSGNGGSTGTALPTYGCFATLEFEDLTSIKTGQPIHATLHVKNGLEKAALRSLRFTPQVNTEDFEDATVLFGFTEEKTTATGFTADGNYLQLAAGKDGTLDLVFIPSADAAAEGPVTYYVSGQLNYIDGSTNIHNGATFPLLTLTVQPSGNVQLTYLIQHNFLGDDADTEAVEESEPAVFALLARNLGALAVSQLKLVADAPVVVGNASAKAVPYEAQYAAVDGQTGAFTFNDFALDQLVGQATAAARWIYTSATSAHVRGMTTFAQSIKAAAGSGADVIVSQPRELVRIVASPAVTPAVITDDDDNALDAKVQALTEGDTYLVNDLEDSERTPDAVITATGEEAPLQVVSTTSSIAGSAADYTLTVNASDAGWVYGRLHDPTNGKMILESVTRQSDGRQVSLSSFWQTSRTPQADYTMVEEQLLHFADMLSGTQETYLLHYGLRPGTNIQILNVQLFTSEGKEVKDGGTTDDPVTKIVVQFTGAIKKLAFNYLSLFAHGEWQNLSNATSSTSDNQVFTVDISSLEKVPGEHSFQINASKLKAVDKSLKVEGNVALTWTENMPQGLGRATIHILPYSHSGSVTPESGEYLRFGSQTFTATPATGYDFSYWADENGKQLSIKPELTLDWWKPRTLTAVFTPQTCNVTIISDDEGELRGYTSGTYAFDEEILLAALPKPGYVFDCWMRNGRHFSDLQATTATVKGNDSYRARYTVKREATLVYKVAMLWNWISSPYIGDLKDPKVFFGDFFGKIKRLMSQTQELVWDPLYEFVGNLKVISPQQGYKLYVDEPFTLENTGDVVNTANRPITLEKGWNWIGYLPVSDLEIAMALSGFTPQQGDMIKWQDAFATFDDGQWKGNLLTLTATEGYMYYSTRQIEFYYPADAPATSRQHVVSRPVSPWQYDYHRYADNTAMTAQLLVDGSMVGDDDFVVGAFCGDECRGISTMIDGRIYLTIHASLSAKDVITFRAYCPATGLVYDIAETYEANDESIGSLMQPFVLHASSTDAIATATASRPAEQVFDLSGRLVKTPQRGVYIQGRTKLVVK